MLQIKINNNITKYIFQKLIDMEEGEIFVCGNMNGLLDFEFGQFVSKEKRWKASTNDFSNR